MTKKLSKFLRFGAVGLLALPVYFFSRDVKLNEANIKLPCHWKSNNSNKMFVGCDQVIDQSYYLGNGLEVIRFDEGPGTMSVKEGLVQSLLTYVGYPRSLAPGSGLYDGFEADPLCKAGPTPLGNAVCDLNFQPSETGGVRSELNTNFKGRSCGEFAKIKAKDGKTSIDFTPGATGNKEASWILGARVQALKCYTAELLTQFKPGTTEIVLKDPVARKLAKDFNTQAVGGFAKVWDSFYARDEWNACNWNNEDIWQQWGGHDDAKRTNQILGKTDLNFETDYSRNPRIIMCGIRPMVQTAFIRVLMTEVLGRMQTGFKKAILSDEAKASWGKVLENEIAKPCQEKCAATPTEACAQGCYNSKIAEVMKKQFDQFWPLPTRLSDTKGMELHKNWEHVKNNPPVDPKSPDYWPVQLAEGKRCL